jgi:Xaa-Pro aminopeptidase
VTLKTVPSSLVFSRDVYERRLEGLRDHDFYLVSSADAEWLTGVPRVATWPEYDPAVNEALTACLVGEQGPVFSVAHALWHLESGEAMRSWTVEELADGADPVVHLRRVAEIAGWRRDRPVHVAPAMPVGQTELLRRAFPDREIRSAAAVLGPLRARKESFEVEAMRDVAARTVAGIESACARLRQGVHRLELFQAVRDEILAQGVDDVGFGPDCWAVGPALAVDWANARTRNANPVLTPPCSVSLDVGAILRGYRSDVGRTIFIGEAPPRSAEALAVLREARAAGAPLLATGRRARDVDDATRALIAERGFGRGQWIPSGHGIGLEFHEPPVLGENDDTLLLDGNVVTFELAVWMDGDAGAFAEDTVVVRDGGPEWVIDGGGEALTIV